MNMPRMTEDMAQRIIWQREDLRATKENLPDPAAMKPQGLKALSQLNRPKT